MVRQQRGNLCIKIIFVNWTPVLLLPVYTQSMDSAVACGKFPWLPAKSDADRLCSSGWRCVLLLHPAPTWTDTGPDNCTLHLDLCTLCCGGCGCNLRWWRCLSLRHWHKYVTCPRGGFIHYHLCYCCFSLLLFTILLCLCRLFSLRFSGMDMMPSFSWTSKEVLWLWTLWQRYHSSLLSLHHIS